MDFRTNAAEITFQRTQNSSGAALAQLDESGCLEISGGRRTHCLFEIPFLIQSLASQLAGLTFLTLMIIDVLLWRWTLELLFLLLVVGLVSRKIKALLLYAHLRVRAGSLVQALKDLPCVDVGLEKGDTYKRLKLVIEDEGLCLLRVLRKDL